MNMSVDFTVEFKSGHIISVHTPTGEDITRRFVRFCAEHRLPVSTEAEVRVAMREFKAANP